MEAALVQAKEDLNEQLHGTGSVVSLPAADSHAMCLLCKFRIWCIVTNLAVVQHACCGSLVLTSVLSAQQMQGPGPDIRCVATRRSVFEARGAG